MALLRGPTVPKGDSPRCCACGRSIPEAFWVQHAICDACEETLRNPEGVEVLSCGCRRNRKTFFALSLCRAHVEASDRANPARAAERDPMV